jgi:hypothetical protein
MNLHEGFEKSIIENEMEGNVAAAYRFSDCDGVHNGKSGWSFGITQIDLDANPMLAHSCLVACGFSLAEIAALQAQTVADMKPMNARLKAAAITVDKYDDRQLDYCLDHVQEVAAQRGFTYADDFAVVCAADYSNQIGMGLNGGLAGHLLALGRPATGQDIYNYKLTIPWGEKRPDDVKRRYNNIARLYGKDLK